MAAPGQYPPRDNVSPQEEQLFSEVMAIIHLDRLAEYASTTRKTIQLHGNPEVSEVDSPIFGSYHVLFPIKFKDGVTWILKVPEDAGQV